MATRPRHICMRCGNFSESNTATICAQCGDDTRMAPVTVTPNTQVGGWDVALTDEYIKQHTDDPRHQQPTPNARQHRRDPRRASPQ